MGPVAGQWSFAWLGSQACNEGAPKWDDAAEQALSSAQMSVQHGFVILKKHPEHITYNII